MKLPNSISIRFIEPSEQRYPTCGDYWIDQAGNWHIAVSKISDARSAIAVALHELVEMAVVLNNGVSLDSIDAFDIEFEQRRKPGNNDEPGNDARAPYYEEHQLSTAIEAIFCRMLRLKWAAHEKQVNDTSE